MVENLTSDDRFAEIWKLLTHNQRRFVVQMTDSSTKKEAAEFVGLDPRTVYNWPAFVDEAVELLMANAKNNAVEILTSALAKAVMIKLAGLESSEEKIRQDVASEIIDRVLGKAKQTTEVSGPEGGPIETKAVMDEDTRDRAIATLADTLTGTLLPDGDGRDGDVGTAEPPAVGGGADASG